MSPAPAAPAAPVCTVPTGPVGPTGRTGPTGPRTAAGKAVSSMNAVTHGLTAKTPLLPGEDAAEFRSFVWGMVNDLSPVGPAESELAHRAALLMWRRRRVADAERQVMEELQQNYWEAEQEEQEAEATEPGPADVASLDVEERRKLDRFILADAFASDDKDGKPSQLERLARYEQRLDRQVDSTLRLLLRLQYRRQGQPGRQEPAPQQPQPRPAMRPPAPSEAPAPPPPAPAQNELAAGATESGQSSRPTPWTGPPGAN